MIKLIKPFVLFGILVLFFGCVVDVKVEQAINKDGSAQLTQSVDIAPFVSYAESIQKVYDTTILSPNENYSAQLYANLPSPESKELELTSEKSYYSINQFKNISVGDSKSFSFELKNNGENITAGSVNMYSDAFIVPPNSNKEHIYSLTKHETDSFSFYGKIANVSSGTYSLTIVINFDRKNEKNITVAKKFSFQVLSKESVKSSINTMETAFIEVCKIITKKDSKVECKYENKKLVLSTIIQPNADYEFNKDEGLFETTYKVIIKKVQQLSNENISLGNGSSIATPTEGRYFKNGMPADITRMRSMFKMTYVVTMPANIENASLGKISEDKRSVTYDIYELYDKKQDIEIIAKEENTLIKYAIIGGVVSVFIIIIGIVLFKFVLMRKK